MFLKNRFGYDANGKFIFAKYDGTKWVGYTDFNRTSASNYDSNYNWGLYGDIKFLNGKIRVGFQQRANINTDKYQYQNGIYYAYSDDPAGLTQWKDYKGTGFNRPLSNSDLIKIAEPGDWVQTTQKDMVYIVSGFDFTVTDRGDEHFVSQVKDNQYNVTKKLHTYRKAGDANFTTVVYNAGSALYASGNDVYVIGLVGGRVNIVKTVGGTSNFQQVYQHTTGPTFDKGVVNVNNGKLYYYLKKAGGTGDKRTTYLQVFDLDIDTTPVDTSRDLNFKNIFNGQEIEAGANLTIEANVGSAYQEVSLWHETTNLGTLTSAPYSWSGHSVLTNMQDSTYTFKLIAKDAQNVEVEQSVTLSVLFPPAPVAQISTDSLVKKLVFYYPLETDGADKSGNAKNATLGSAVTFAPGKIGNAAKFSKTAGSYLTSADSVYKYNHPTAYTVAFWLKVSDYSERLDILQPVGGRTLLYSNGDLTFKTFHQKQSALFSVADEDKYKWFHVAMVIDQREGATQHKYYINGEQRGDIKSGYALETDFAPAIGRLIFGASSDEVAQRNFDGMIDEIYMFNDTLASNEVKYLMNTSDFMTVAGKTSLNMNFDNPAVVAEWTIESGSATTEIVENTLSRTGSNVLKTSAFSSNTGFHFVNNVSDKVVAKPGDYVHSIIYASSKIAGGQAAASFSSAWAKVTPTFANSSTTEFSRFSMNRQYPTTEVSSMDIFPRLRLKPGADLSNELYVDDLVLYVHSSSTTDFVSPTAATNFEYLTQNASTNSFSWTEGADELTGIQGTYILRASIPKSEEVQEAPESPVLLPQVKYSVDGGSTGQNNVGVWSVIATLPAGVTSYTDESLSSDENYYYAIVHRDLAYNNSAALLSVSNGNTSVNRTNTPAYVIYPVPAKNRLYIKGDEVVTARVYDVTGRLVMQNNEIIDGLNISLLSNGLYLIKLFDRKGNSTSKTFIKQ